MAAEPEAPAPVRAPPSRSAPWLLIIPAAGSGLRFGGPLPKQFCALAGRPVLSHALAAFAGAVDAAVLAVGSGMEEHVRALLARHPPAFPVRLVAGGATRQASVAAALAACPDDAWALVHDGVRPLVDRRLIAACQAALQAHPQEAVVAAERCVATVKRQRADDPTRVLATVERSDLWLAQTPQGFAVAVARPAYAQALAAGWACSDDAQVMERAGIPVRLVPSDAGNLKITTPADLALAEAMLGAVRSLPVSGSAAGPGAATAP
jgi:2-C-methyl-D-erythritol 4-phosphate cytidylyltransferase